MDSTASSSTNIKPEAQQALTVLAYHAEHLIETEPFERDHMPLMRNKAFELGIHEDVKDAELEAWLDAARRKLSAGKIYSGGDILDIQDPVFFLDGMIRLGEANIVVGAPKVGKSSFICGLIAALRDRRETFLGRRLLLPNHRCQS